MTATKWGGTFTTLDPVARVPVRGRVFGEVDGVDPSEQEMAGRIVVHAFNTATTNGTLSFLDDDAARELGELTEAELAAQGKIWQVKVHGIRLDPASAAMVAKAAPATTATAEQELPIGADVAVEWSDGNKYPGKLLEAAAGRYRVGFPDGQEHWVDARYVSKG